MPMAVSAYEVPARIPAKTVPAAGSKASGLDTMDTSLIFRAEPHRTAHHSPRHREKMDGTSANWGTGERTCHYTLSIASFAPLGDTEGGF